MERNRRDGRGGTWLRSGDVEYYLPRRGRPSGHYRAHQLVLGRNQDWRRLTGAGAPLQRVYGFGRVCESQPAVSRWQVAGSAGASWSGVNRSAASLGKNNIYSLAAFGAADRTVFGRNKGERNSRVHLEVISAGA